MKVEKNKNAGKIFGNANSCELEQNTPKNIETVR